ncbi:MAG: NHL repeat-containing protein, partial [Terracidiphilus sp.]
MSKTRSRRVSLLFSILAVPALSVNVAAQVAQFNFAQLTLNNGFSAPAGVGVDASGNIYVADTGNNAVKEVAPGCILAGCAVTLGSGFKGPSAIAVDASGNVFVADTGNHAVKEMLAVNGSIPASPTINTLGSGFSSPVAVAVDQGGNVYVADQGNGTVKEIPAAGGFTSVTTLGSSFSSPSGVAVDVSGDVFVTDSSKNIVQEIVAVGGSIPASPTINTLAGGFSRPAGVAVDGSGDVFVADSGNGLVKELVAVSGSIPASASVIDFGAGLGTPTGIALGSNGTIYTADPKNNNAVVLETQAVNLGTVAVNSDSGTFSLVFSFTSGGALGAPGLLTMGTGGLDFEVLSNGTTCAAGSVSAGSTCTFKVYFNPRVAGERNGAAVLYDASTPANVLATVYLHGIGSGPVLSFPPGAISAIAGNGTQGFNNDNIAATSAELNSPGSVALDGAGDTYIADTGNERIREVSASSGLISTVAGSGTGCGSQTDSLGDGCPATSATLSSPAAVALDGAGNLYIADKGNQRIRVVNASTGVIETVAGGGTGCAAQTDASGDGCAATDAKLSNPSGIALDGAGNLYIADTQDGAVRVVSAATGIISEIAAVSSPAGVALDTAGNLYISESSAALVQELNLQTGAVATVAGGGIGCADESDPLGDGCPATAAKLNSPGGIALDPGGDLYIADQPAGVIRAVSASTGLISTAAGGGTGCTGQTDSVGDGCPSTSALIAPAGIAVYPNGNIVIADSTGQLVRKVDVADAPPLVFPSTPVASVSSTLYVTPESIGNQPLIEDGFDFFGDNFGLDET